MPRTGYLPARRGAVQYLVLRMRDAPKFLLLHPSSRRVAFHAFEAITIWMTSMNYRNVSAVLVVALLATACGGNHDHDNSSNNGGASPGQLTAAPTIVQTLTAAALTTQLKAISPSLLLVAGQPKCGITIYSFGYKTVGGRDEPTTAGGAVMVPSGNAPGCGGAQPVVLYDHGVTTDKNFDMTKLDGDIDGELDSALVAAFYAAQGFVVVAPNYAGYAGSTLSYHPFVNAIQQSSDTMDALRAARSAFGNLGITDSGKLFVTGYSQGGYAALATQRAMQADTNEFKVTAAATGSGPYALSLFLDREFEGETSAVAPLLLDLVANGWQNSYGNVLANPAELVAPPYTNTALGLLPGTTPQTTLFAQNLLPVDAVFQTGTSPGPDTSNPDTALLAQAGFAPANFFVTNGFRSTFLTDVTNHPCSAAGSNEPIRPCAPASGLRQDALLNDLRNYVPNVPLQMCGAHSDNLVFFVNTQLTAEFFTGQGVSPSNLTVIDVDPGSNQPSGPFAALQTGFNTARAQAAASLGTSPAAAIQLASGIHKIAEPFCFVAAQSLFQSLR